MSAARRGRPIRFLGFVGAGWVGLRAVMLWPQAPAALLPTIAPAPGAATRALVETLATPAAAAPVVSPRPPRVAPVWAAGIRHAAAHIAPLAPEPPQVLAPAPIRTTLPPGLPNDAGGAASPRPGSRWSGSAWLAARGGAGLAPGTLGGQLGGSQAGVRLAWLLDRRHRLALAARVASPLGAGLREAALGVEWQPTRLPIRLVAERRIALGPGHGGPAIGMVGGFGPAPLPLGFRLEGYGQAGVIRRADTEPYGDGALHLAHPLASLGRVRFDLGAGAWGAAQRGAARLDLGPSLGASVPLGRQTVRIALDWRARVAGDAYPRSGPALTLGADF